MALSQQVQDFLLGFSGCNGGKIGNPNAPSIWVCGIEWGGESATPQELQEYINNRLAWDNPGDGDESMLQYPYGRSTAKLLTAIDGGNVEDYAEFFERYKPYDKNSEKGHFQLNLYPLNFKNTDPKLWIDEYKDITGFSDKGEYVRWCRRYRFPKMNEWVNLYQPKLVICYGLTYEDDFNTAFSDGYTKFNLELIDGLRILWKKSDNGTVVAVLPFPNIAKALQRNESHQKIGEFLAEKIK